MKTRSVPEKRQDSALAEDEEKNSAAERHCLQRPNERSAFPVVSGRESLSKVEGLYCLPWFPLC